MLRDVLPPVEGARDYAPAPIPGKWKHRQAGDITRAELAALHARLGEDAGHYRANRVIALLRTIYNKRVEWGLPAGDNPAEHIKMFKEHERDRFLAGDELRRVIRALDAEPEWWGVYFKLSLLLGPRKKELLSARWDHIDVVERVWRIPHTKAGRPHRLPLSKIALKLLTTLPREDKNPWIFPSTKSVSGHLEEPKTAWARILTRAGVKDVRIHDLRRTLGSWLAAEGHSLPLIGKALNHSQPSTTAIYARLELGPLRIALKKVEAKMLGR